MPGSDQGIGTVQTPSGAGERTPTSPGAQEDVTQAGTLYPPWSLRSTRQIDPRVRPNLGKRVLTSYHPIKGGPLLYPTFSPLTPDYLGEQTARPWSLRASTAFFAVDDERASSKLQEYRDLTDPVVQVSGDGTLGWVIVQVEARGSQTNAAGGKTPLEFVSAWIELYEKRDGRWLRTGNVSNFKP